MKPEILEIPTDTKQGKTATQLNVVIAYADFESATIARRILEQSLAVLASRYTVNNSFWKFDLLNSSALRELAREDAAEAHIIIISADKECALPQGAREWVEWCLTRPEVQNVSFVALVRDGEEGMLEFPSGFQQFERRTDFFWFIANESERLAVEKIIELACQHSLAQQVA